MPPHVEIGITDLDRALAFCRAVLAEIGCVARFVAPQVPWAALVRPGAPRPPLLIGRPLDGMPASPGRGRMVALLAPNRAAVRAAHAAALRLGGTDAGAPGLRPHCHPDYYGADLRDPDGDKLCFCCHDPRAVVPRLRPRRARERIGFVTEGASGRSPRRPARLGGSEVAPVVVSPS